MTFLAVFWASCGRISTKIGGHQTEALPDVPIQPRTVDFVRKTKTIAKDISNKLIEKVISSDFHRFLASRPVHKFICTVFDEESESAVSIEQFRHPEAKIKEIDLTKNNYTYYIHIYIYIYRYTHGIYF